MKGSEMISLWVQMLTNCTQTIAYHCCLIIEALSINQNILKEIVKVWSINEINKENELKLHVNKHKRHFSQKSSKLITKVNMTK
jgi:hypothetical protein